MSVDDNLGFHKLFVVDCSCYEENRSGGLCVLWKDDLVVDILSHSTHHVDLLIEEDHKTCYQFTGLP